MKRHILEWQSRMEAGIRGETDDYYLVKVLGLFEMYCMKGDESLTPCLTTDGFWESWITQYLWDRMGAGTVFFDVGANTGYYSFLAWALGSMVAAYEPNPRYYDMMKKTMEHLGIQSNGFRVSNRAISDTEGTTTLHIPKGLHGSASFTRMDERYEPEAIEVETQPLLLNGCGHYIIKIDAEGAEEKIWDGMIGQPRMRTGPTEVLLEYTPGAYSDEFLDKLEAFAPLAWINGDGQREPVSREWILDQKDWVMLILNPAYRTMDTRG